MTPHINAKKGDFAKIVLMPGDALRAKHFAETFLKDVRKVNDVRNMLMYTGTYNGKEISICASGMGQPSIGIYAYELFKFYDVEKIIRIGSSGAYTKDLKMYDIVLVDSAFSDSNTFNKILHNVEDHVTYPSEKLNAEIEKHASNLGIKLHKGRTHSSDVFYSTKPLDKVLKETGNAICVEMESAALFAIAKKLNKEAACLLTIVDHIITKEKTTWEEREKTLTNMVKVALELA